MLLGPGPALAAINAHRTDGAVIEQNLVLRTAYHGIRFAGRASIRRNVVIDSCLRLSDCGAIYTWRRNAEDRRPAAEVRQNVIAGVLGDASVKFGVNDWFVGIYIDDYSNNVRVSDNVVVGANQGIYLHNTWNVEVEGNFVRARHRPLVDALDAGRRLPYRTEDNRWIDNSSEAQSVKRRWRKDDGAEAPFSFDEPLFLDLEPEGRALPAPQGRCSPARGVPEGLPVVTVRECT